MRGGAAIGILVVAAGCGSLATTADAPPGASDADPSGDGGPPDAAACSYTCYAPSMNGEPSLIGTARCSTAAGMCQAGLDWLEPIDLCACTVGIPALFVLPDAQATARVALVAPFSPTGLSVSMSDTAGNCYGSGSCGADPNMACGNAEVSVWVNIPLGPGDNRYAVFDDDGTGCAMPRYTFVFTR